MESVKENIISLTPDNFQAEVLECGRPVLQTCAGNFFCLVGSALPDAAIRAGFDSG